MFLKQLHIPRAPLRYGTDSCCIQLCDSTYSSEIRSLRNSDLGPFLSNMEIAEEEHERWMTSRAARSDVLDFVILIQGAFGGTVSLTEIEHGKVCELGRMMIPNDGRRVYHLAAQFLGISFGFEMLGVQEMYCAVAEKNDRLLRLQLRNGWKLNPAYNRVAMVNGSAMQLVGLSVVRASWPELFSSMKNLVMRLLNKESAPVVFENAEP